MQPIVIHGTSTVTSHTGINPLPQLLQTPSGLALLELQGTINLPLPSEDDQASNSEIPIGRLIFPAYDPANPDDKAWMKQVFMYVGKHQRLTGEVKKLPKAIAVIRKRPGGEESNEELEVVEIVKFKVLFSTRPEPVGTLRVGE